MHACVRRAALSVWLYLCRYGNTSPHRLRRNTVLTLGMKEREGKATNTTNRAASKTLSNGLKHRLGGGKLELFHCQAAPRTGFRGLLNFLFEPDSGGAAGVGVDLLDGPLAIIENLKRSQLFWLGK